MKKTILLSAAIFILLCNASLHSQMKDKFAKQNTWEISGSFSLKNIKYVSEGKESDGITYMDIMPYAGYFAADGLELGILPVISFQDYNNYDMTDVTIYFAPSYNIYTKSVFYPYFQGAIGYSSISGKGVSDASGFAWQVETGLKCNLFYKSLLKIGLNYGQRTLETSRKTSGERDGLNAINFSIGFGVFFN